MKKNRRSQLHKADRNKEKAIELLANFTWEKEERILLEIMAQGTITLSDIREAAWTDVSRGLHSVIIKGVELKLTEESLADFDEALEEKKDFTGGEFDPRDTLHKIISHKTGKEISRTLAQA